MIKTTESTADSSILDWQKKLDDQMSTCPNCGYCPHCGRKNDPWRFIQPYYPAPYYHPYKITWTSSTNKVSL